MIVAAARNGNGIGILTVTAHPYEGCVNELLWVWVSMCMCTKYQCQI